jgi:hypothetical protein
VQDEVDWVEIEQWCISGDLINVYDSWYAVHLGAAVGERDVRRRCWRSAVFPVEVEWCVEAQALNCWPGGRASRVAEIR